MIQRIQSVYLLFGALLVLALLFFGAVWQSQAAEAFAWFAPALLALGGLTSIAALVAIFLYGDRRRQRRVVLGAQVLTVLLVLVLFGGLYLSGELSVVDAGGVLDVSKLVALLLPIVAYVLFFMARRAIESDIELVRSMDRLR